MVKPVKKPKKAKTPASQRSNPGFAAALDPRDLTYVWNQNPDLAEQILTRLADTVRGAVKTWQGRIGNFTGDGFLLMFPQAEYAVRGLAAAIDAWEPHRRQFSEELFKLNAPLPDERSLMLRTGIAHGHYRIFRGMERNDIAGEVVSRTSRYEGASKAHFEADILEGSLAPHQRIFVTQDVFNLIESKADYWYSLRVEFRGSDRRTASGLAPPSDHIVALWPKSERTADQIAAVSPEKLLRAARGTSRLDVADRLVEAARRIGLAEPLIQVERDSPGRPAAREILLRAIPIYREALELIPADESPARWTGIQNNLGAALRRLANLHAGPERAARLAEAASAYRETLKVRTLESSPADYAMTQNNLSTVLCDEAELLAGPERAECLTEAVRAGREALRVYRLESSALQYAMTQNNLGNSLRRQAELLAGPERAARLTDTVSAFREALRVYAPESSPADYATTQYNLGVALRDQAELLAGTECVARLAEAASALREALKVYTLESSPAEYASTQNNLGVALHDQAELLTWPERATRVTEAVSACREALKVYTLDSSPAEYAITQYNLGNALGIQAELLAKPERVARLTEAVNAYRETLKVCTLEASPADYATTQHNLGNALGVQAELLAGPERAGRLTQAKTAYVEALKVFTEADFPRQHQLVKRVLVQLSFLSAG